MKRIRLKSSKVINSAGCAISLILLFAATAECKIGMGPGSVPRVAYLRPADESTVDISGQKSIIFKWGQVPIPSGNRDSYRFVVRKGDGYDTVANQVIDPRTFFAQIPADKFETGQTYCWYVRQRDARTLEWSQYDIWYFKVVKTGRMDE